jgi:hypothetical protein
MSQHAGPFLPSASDNLASPSSDNLHPTFGLPRASCKWMYFQYVVRFGRGKNVFLARYFQ